MPLTRFLGVQTGSPVSMIASQSGETASVSLAQWNVPTPDLSIDVRRAPVVFRRAPEAVWFEARPSGFGLTAPENTLIYSPEFHEIFYEWDFGDTGAVFTAPVNGPAASRNANRAIGQFACHVYEQPGSYTATCTARRIISLDPLMFVEAAQSVQVTVGDRLDIVDDSANGLFNEYNTLVLSKDGDFAGAPAGMQIVYPETEQGFDDAHRALYTLETANALPQGDRVFRILLKRGETDIRDYWFDGEVFTHSSNRQHVYVGTWGDAGLPKPQTRGLKKDSGANFVLPDSRSLVFDQIAILGFYDPIVRDLTEEYDTDTYRAGMKADGAYRVYTGCDITDFPGIAWYIGLGVENDPDYVYAIHNCRTDNVADYSVFGSMDHVGRLAVLGCNFTHPPEGKKHPNTTTPANPTGRKDHGPIRITNLNKMIIDGNDFFSIRGWSGATNWPDGRSSVAGQPCCRLGMSGTAEDKLDVRLLLTRNTSESEGKLASIADLSNRPTVRGNALVDSNFHVSTAGTGGGGVIGTDIGAITVRNNLHVYPDVPDGRNAGKSRSYAFNLYSGRTAEEIENEPIADYNNTYICLRTQPNLIEDVELDPEWINYTISNNVLMAPNIPSQPGHLDIAPFDATELFDARYIGRFEMDDAVLQPQYATPDGTVSLYRPQAGSPVAGAATAGYVSLYDLLGNPRWPNIASGALQPE